jgi:UDP-N-acetylmuramoyl-L-alanyl-D-glutamate--2,6-diaminopimelate ligase
MVAYQEVPAIDLRALWVDAHFISAQATKKRGSKGESAAVERISEFLVTRCVDRVDHVLPGDAFVALDMPDRDGHDEALQAIAAGAALVICERYLPVSAPQCIVEDSRQAWGELCHALAGQPTDQLITIAIIGTHGKTTLNLLTSSMMKSIGQKIAYRNSLATSDGATQVAAEDAPVNCPKSMAKWLSGAVQQQVPSAVIEIDTEMLYHGKTAGLQYDLIMLTSLRTEKVNETGNSDQLQQAIIKQFGQLKEHGVVLYNADDAPLSRWMHSLALPALAYGIDADADVRGRVIERESGEQTMMITAGRMVMPLRSPLIGSHNARHLLGAVAAGYACGLELSEVVGGVEKLQRVPGRMQRVSAGQEFGVFVDQANTADRLAVALHAARQHSTGRVLCVMDISATTHATALSQIGRVLEKGAAEVCLTHAAGGTFKSVQKNAFALLDGFENPALPHVLPDRDKAIEWILHRAKPGDVVLLAGCGDQAWSSKSHPLSTNDFKAAGNWLRQPKPEVSQVLSTTVGDSSFQEDISHSAPQPIRGDKPKLKLFRPE